MKMTSIRLGGVPEHFNLPIHLAKEKKEFANRGVDLHWTTFKGGTGQMTKALREGEVDACVLLTEGIIKDIIAGNEAKIISVYVNTPLIWGIHTGAKNELKHHANIYDKRIGISRFGSGSHLMPIVDATTQDRKINNEQFHVIKNLEGALTSLENLETDVFYWEKYTTKPYVDSGQLRRVGQFLSPWPCFVIAARNEILEKAPEAVIRMLRTIHDATDQFMQLPNAIDLVSEKFGQKPSDVERWYHATEWAIHGWVSEKMIQSVLFNLRTAKIIAEDAVIPELIWRR